MSVVASRGDVRSIGLSDRLLAALPLASVYVWLSSVYAFEAWQRVTPWLFGDELEFTQLSRSIAATGHPAERGQAHGFDSLYTYFTSLFWHIDKVAAAYAAIKYVDVLVMAAVVFPTYFLARMVVGKNASLFAAACAGAIPSLAYSSYLVEEPIAYPYAALCFFAVARAFIAPTRRKIALAVVLSALAPAVRTELAVIPGALLLGLLFFAWSSERARRWREGWSVGDWVGAIVLAFGAIFVLAAIGSSLSYEILRVTRGYKHREIVEGNWAAGSLAIGMGILPFIAGIAALFRAPGETPNRNVRAFRSVATAGIVVFAVYTAVKAAYLSTAFATRVEERNLIYIAPLLFIGTALVFSRRRVSPLGLVAASAYTIYLLEYALYHVTQYPYQMGVQLYSDALGFAILQQGNRYLAWTPHFVRELLLVMALVSIVVLVLPRFRRLGSRNVAVVTAVAAIGVVGWNLTGEIAAAAGTASISRAFATTLKHPFSWVDDNTHLQPTLYLGQAEVDQNAEWLLEFWNRSIARVSSLDGSLGGPGPAGGPNFTRGGALYSGEDVAAGSWRYAYGVEDLPCINFEGRTVARHPYLSGGRLQHWQLVRLTVPNRIQSDCVGIYPDGWTGSAVSSYFHFLGPSGWLRIVYSRRDWGYASGPSPVEITLGTMAITSHHQPIMARALRKVHVSIDSLKTKVLWLRVPAGGFVVNVSVAKPVVPADFNKSSGDRRQHGVELTYDWRPTKPHR